jgi:hypothetical protein
VTIIRRRKRQTSEEENESKQLELELPANELPLESKDIVTAKSLTGHSPSTNDKAIRILKKFSQNLSNTRNAPANEEPEEREQDLDSSEPPSAYVSIPDENFQKSASLLESLKTSDPNAFRLGYKSSEINSIMSDLDGNLRGFEPEEEYWDDGNSWDETEEIASDEYWAFLASFE